MRKINCICYIEDPEYKKVLSTFLLSSGIFNITEEGASGTESVNSSSELSIRFMDNLLNPVNDSENAPGEKTGDNTKPNANHPSPCILLSEKRGERFRDNVLEIYKYTPFGEIIKKTNEYFHLEDFIPEVKESTVNGRTAAICGVQGGIGVSAIARSIARIKYREGFKPLYIDLSPVNYVDWAEAKDRYDENDMARLVYRLKRKQKVNLELYTSKLGAIDTIGRGVINTCIHMMDREVAEGILNAGLASRHDYYVFDMGNHLDRRNMEIFKWADLKIMIFPAKMEKNRKFLDDIKEFVYMLPPGVVAVSNDSMGRVPRGWLEMEYPEITDVFDGIIPYCGTIGEKSVDTEFGNAVGLLLEKMGG